MNKYIFIGLEVVFCIIWVLLSYGERNASAAFVIGGTIGAAVWLVLFPYGLVYLFSRKSPNKHLKAFIISLILFVLLCIGHLQKRTLPSAQLPARPTVAMEQNKEAMLQARTAIESFATNKDYDQLNKSLSAIKESEYTDWLRQTLLSFSQGMQQLISDLQLDHELFADPYILSSKPYLEEAISGQQKILNSISDKLIDDKLKTLWDNAYNQMYNSCLRSYPDNVCREIRRGFSSMNNDFSLVSRAAKKRLEYLEEEISLARFISRNYDNIDKKSEYPAFKNADLQRSLQNKLQRLMSISSEIENIHTNSIDTMRRKTAF